MTFAEPSFHLAPEPTPRSRSKLWVPEVQYARCMSTKYKDIPFSRCVSCTRRWAGDTCRFQNLRYFLKDKAEDNYPAFAFAEYHHTRPIRSKHEYPQSWNVNLTIEHIQKMKVGLMTCP
jgi:lysine-specific demethylase 3